MTTTRSRTRAATPSTETPTVTAEMFDAAQARIAALEKRIADLTAPKPEPRKPKHAIGDYLMHNDCVVEITNVQDGGGRGPVYGIGYRSAHGAATDPLSNGGGSMWWGENDLKPITDPVLRLRAELTKTTREQAEHVRGLERAKERIVSLKMALQIATSTGDTPAK